MEDGWADSHGVRLHYLDTRRTADASLVPIVFIPGRFGAAEDYFDEFAALQPRRCVAASLRGRGKSEIPPRGYDFGDHVADVSAVLAHLSLGRYCLMGYSMGVPMVLACVLQRPRGLIGMILADYPARYPAVPPGWAQIVVAANPTRARPEVAKAIERESPAHDILFWDELAGIGVPVLILRGDQPDALLSAQDAERYLRGLRHGRLIVLKDSGHALYGVKYMEALREFLVTLD